MNNVEKKELLEKTASIYEIYKKVCLVKKKMENVDNESPYVRKVIEPKCPKLVRIPVKPVKSFYTRQEKLSQETYLKKLPIGFGIATLLQAGIYFAAKAGIDGSGSVNDQAQIAFTNFFGTVFWILFGIFALFILWDFIIVLKVLLGYDKYLAEVDESFKEDVRVYNEQLKERNEYVKEQSVYEEALAQYQAETKEIQERIRVEMLEPLMNKLREESAGIIGEKYYDKIPQIYECLESGRADSVKEAIGIVEEDIYKEKQLDLERERMEQEEEAREREAAREEYRYQESLYRQELQRKEDLYREERQREEDLQREKERAREQEEKDRRDASRQCMDCANFRGCRNFGKYPNCPNYRHKNGI